MCNGRSGLRVDCLYYIVAYFKFCHHQPEPPYYIVTTSRAAGTHVRCIFRKSLKPRPPKSLLVHGAYA